MLGQLGKAATSRGAIAFLPHGAQAADYAVLLSATLSIEDWQRRDI